MVKDANTSIALPTEFRYHRLDISIAFHVWSGNLETNMSVNGCSDLEAYDHETRLRWRLLVPAAVC